MKKNVWEEFCMVQQFPESLLLQAPGFPIFVFVCTSLLKEFGKLKNFISYKLKSSL
jgi:hypothetical protein